MKKLFHSWVLELFFYLLIAGNGIKSKMQQVSVTSLSQSLRDCLEKMTLLLSIRVLHQIYLFYFTFFLPLLYQVTCLRTISHLKTWPGSLYVKDMYQQASAATSNQKVFEKNLKNCFYGVKIQFFFLLQFCFLLCS